MITKGQIVEIPANSPIYKKENAELMSKKEELFWKIQNRDYSLFDGFLVGEHQGVNHFILGQRKGINVGGKPEPLYVISIDDADNRLFVGAGESHPGLWNTVFSFEDRKIEWQNDQLSTKENLENGVDVEIASSESDKKMTAKLYIFDHRIFLEFDNLVSIKIQNSDIVIFHLNHRVANLILNKYI